MMLRRLVHALAIVTAASSAFAADIVLTPPAGGGIAVTNAAGNATQLRVADDGITLLGNIIQMNSSATAGSIMKGGLPFIHNFGNYNTFVGQSAGNFTMTGRFNTTLGSETLWLNTTGDQNTAIGLSALSHNTGGQNNTAIGSSALWQNTTGTFNIAVGQGAGGLLTTGDHNIAIGNGGVAGESSTIRLGNPAVHVNTYLAGNVNVDSARAINFGATTRQMLNLWNADYGIGVQDFTLYSRSGDRFSWFKGGVHSAAVNSPGAGGVELMRLTTGGLTVNGAVVLTSDRNAKENFAAVDSKAMLEKVASLPLQSWNYRADEGKVRHLGPMAQDFHAAFGVGPDDRHIATVDESGVALAAIQGLNAKLEERDAAMQRMMQEKDAQIAAQAARVAQLERDRQAQSAEIVALQAVVSEIAELRLQTAHLARMIDRSRNGADFVSSNAPRGCTTEWAGCGTRSVRPIVD